MTLGDQIAEIIDELLDDRTDLVQINCGTKVQNYRDIATKQRTNAINQILALLPSLKGFVKMVKCPNLGNGMPNGICSLCKDTGEICVPLELEDMDWDGILQEIWERHYIITTKTGEVIKRKEK